MDPQDDPEARIKALEQPLADNARATELGTTPYTTSSGGDAGAYGKGAYLPPPVPPMPPQAPGPDYGAQYTPPGYGAPWAPPPPQKTSAGIPWVVLGIGAAVFMAVAVGVGVYISTKSTRNFPIINIPSISVPSFPGIPSIQPNVPSGGPANTQTPAQPGGQLSVSGISENKTLTCNNSQVSISGVSNTVTITGHCATVTVSGMQNQVTLDTSDQIDASGMNNVVTYHSGSPDVNNGGSNVVQQG
ncbi:MAG: hypothetical protein QOC63_4862 [Mycobacterium sp.]|jgi:hypothetical protein|nr:hypothetical protein [Mycobacterium sp.]